MIPVLAHVRAKSLEQFGELVRHSGEEYTYVLEGRVVLHTEFYDPKVMEVGESVYIDSNMGHAYLAGDGCDEAVVLCVCSSADETLMESLLNLRGNNNAAASTLCPDGCGKAPQQDSPALEGPPRAAQRGTGSLKPQRTSHRVNFRIVPPDWMSSFRIPAGKETGRKRTASSIGRASDS